ncbi:MAG: hypothetical protein ACLP05_00465 [Candidatus Kryptoniota bacterium]
MKIIIGFASLSSFISGCGHGLEPPPAELVQPGFGGTVYFENWPHPPADSVYDIRVVAFYNYPPQSIITAVLDGQVQVFPTIGIGTTPKLFVDSMSYSFKVASPTVFRYVAVAMEYGPNDEADWKAVGAYGYSHGVGAPDSVVIPPNTYVNGIDINVDFKNPPPNPLSASVTAASK